ncbi:ATP synthase subunit A [Methylobacter luteus]|uniref:ATP synthase subunit A n=1 Tax=Methylobacter luteus TaxID=415 RepID=UPI0004111567|nr:ATP synthase subunit A [Methylobacter luteus]
MNNEKLPFASSGVEALIERLKEEGIAAGQKKAESIVIDAEKRAEWIIKEAQLEAQSLVNEARAEAEAMKAAGEDALKLAARDVFLQLRDTLLGSFSQEVTRVVGKQMAQKDFLEKLILALAGRVRDKTDIDSNRQVVIQLPEDVIGVEELRRNPEELREGALTRLTASIAADLLREGVKFEVSDDLSSGLLIKLEEDNIVIDFSDKTVAALLLDHIQPRFRALLQGIIK